MKNRIISFIKLDFLTVAPYLTIKNLIIVGAISMLLSIGSGPIVSVFLLTIYGTVYGSYPFAIGEQNGIDMLYCSLGISKRSVVVGRYIFSVLIGFSLSLVGYLLSILSIYFINATDSQSVMGFGPGVLGICICVIIFNVSIQTPIYFKYGYNKARLFRLFPLALCGGIMGAVASFGDGNLTEKIMGLNINTHILAPALLIISVAMFLFSMKISEKAYAKRDF